MAGNNAHIAFPQNADSILLGKPAGVSYTFSWRSVLSAFANASEEHYSVSDDFLGAALDTNLWTVDASATGSVAYGTLAEGGLVRLTTDVNDNDHATLSGDSLFSPTGLFQHWRGKIPTAITDRAVELGVSDAASETNGLAFSSHDATPVAVATDALVFGYDSDESMTTWSALAVNNGVAQYADTGIAVDTDWHNFSIFVVGNDAHFYIDGVRVAVLTNAVRSAATFRAWATAVTRTTAAFEFNVDVSVTASSRE